MNKVTFDGQLINVNGIAVGVLEGTKEVYVRLLDGNDILRTVARFKYKSPKASAKHWLKFILQYYNNLRLVELLYVERKLAPLTLAEKHGYVSLNMQQALKKQAEADKWKNTPITIVTMEQLMAEKTSA